MTVKELCKIYDISYKGYLAFLNRYNIHHTEDIIHLYKKFILIQQKMQDKGFNCPKPRTIYTELNETTFNKYIDFVYKLYNLDLKFENVERYKNNHNIEDYNIALIQYVNFLKEKHNRESLGEILKVNKISDNQFYYYRNLSKYKDKTDLELVEFIKNIVPFSDFCSRHNIEYNIALKIRGEHPEYSNDDILDAVRNYHKKPSTNYEGSFKEKCDIAKINYNNARTFKRENNLTDEQAIIYYKPYYYINIFGELIMTD